MAPGESLPELSTTQFHLRERLFDLDGAIENGLRLDVEIHGALRQLVRLVRCLGGVDVLLHQGQLVLQELERLGGLGALTLDVLAQVGPRDGIEDIGDLLLVFSIERDRDDAGLLSLLADAQVGLQVVDHTRPAALLDAKLRARA